MALVWLEAQMCGSDESFKVAGRTEFGWKEDAYECFQSLYAAQARGASLKAQEQIMGEQMPCIVHVRDQGGHGWEKDWRLAQLGWWDARIKQIGDLSVLLKRVVEQRKGKVVHLRDVDIQTVATVRR